MFNIGYLIPEFPSQTHVWIWREIVHMRESGAQITIFSTRRPLQESRARHAFAPRAEAETVYLWPVPILRSLMAVLLTALRHPIGFLRAVLLSLRLPVESRRVVIGVLPLLIPACALAREVAARNIKHLHSHSCSNSAILCMLVKRLCGTPFSLTLNANIEWWGGAMQEKFQDAEFTVAITQWLLDQLWRDYPNLKPNQALLGRIGVDTQRWKPDGSGAPALLGAVRVMTIGRLHASKGHDVLLRAIKILADRGADASLQIAGAGPELEALQRLVEKLEISARVQFLGSLSEDDLIEHLRSTDMFVLASHAEPLGVVYMEAMALAVPVIGTAAGGVGEIVQSGANGILVPPGDPTALADAIHDLARDADRRHRLGENGRDTIVNQFDSRIGARTLFNRLFTSGSKANVS